MVNLAPPLPTSGAAARIGSSAIRDLLHLTERPDVLSLAGGLPSPAAFPVAELAAATAAVLAEQATAALQYAPTEGVAELRTWVAEGQRGGGVDVDQVVITNGSQQALELLARATVAPGGIVALADPAYVGALQAFRAAGATLSGIPTDEEGMRVDVLAERLARGLRPVLVYVVASFDNPSGTTLPDDRRDALAALAERYGFLVVEDDPYGELRWAGAAPAPMAARTDRVVTLRTTSKLLTPGLRVGWAIGPAPLVRDVVVLKQAADLHTSGFTQRIVHRVLTAPGFLERHRDELRDRYRHQCTTLATALRTELGDRLRFTEPDGGMFLWARLTGDGDTAALLPAAVAAGVAYVPGAAFAVEGHDPTGLRLSFATADEGELREAARRLAAVLR